MKVKDNKSLLQFIFQQMEKLDSSEINVEQAKAQSNLAKQANNSFKYELDRVKTLIKVKEHNSKMNDTLRLREVD